MWYVCHIFSQHFLSSLKFLTHLSSMSSLMFLRTDWTQTCADDTGNSLRTFPSAQSSMAVDFAPVEISPTHGPRMDVDVSLTDFHPHYLRHSCPFCLCHPLPYSFCHSSSPFFQKNKKVVKFSQCDVTHRDRGGNRSTHYPGKWIVSLCVRTEHPVQPLLYLSISKPYHDNYHQQTLQYQQLVDSTMVLSTVG